MTLSSVSVICYKKKKTVHRTKGKLYNYWLIIRKTTQEQKQSVRNSQIEEMGGQGTWEEIWSFHATLPAPPWVHQPETSLNTLS